MNAEEENVSWTTVVKGRPAHLENDGQRKTRRYENRQGLEANRWCNACDGSKAPRVVEHAGIKY